MTKEREQEKTAQETSISVRRIPLEMWELFEELRMKHGMTKYGAMREALTDWIDKKTK